MTRIVERDSVRYVTKTLARRIHDHAQEFAPQVEGRISPWEKQVLDNDFFLEEDPIWEYSVCIVRGQDYKTITEPHRVGIIRRRTVTREQRVHIGETRIVFCLLLEIFQPIQTPSPTYPHHVYPCQVKAELSTRKPHDYKVARQALEQLTEKFIFADIKFPLRMEPSILTYSEYAEEASFE